MANNKPPSQRVTGIRAPIPSGYILGRVSVGYGDVELISMAKAQSAGLIPVTLPPSGPAGGDLSGTYPNPTVAKINTQTLPAPTSTAFAVLMYSGGALAWVNQHLNGGSTGMVPTKNSNTDFDISWATPHYLIAGGTTGQVLTKNSNSDYDVVWTTPSSGSGGASSFYLDGTHGYVAQVDSSGLLVLDSSGKAVYNVDPVLPLAMIPVSSLPAAPYPTGYRRGGITANNAGTPNTKIDIAPFTGRDSTDTVNMKTLVTLTIDATTNGANGLDTGSLANTTSYHSFIIQKADGTTAALLSTSPTSPTLPSGYLYFRRMGGHRTDGSAHILAYLQTANSFLLGTPIQDVAAVNPGTSAITCTMSVPAGITVFPILTVDFVVDTNTGAYISAMANPDLAVNFPSVFTFGAFAATGGGVFVITHVPTNTSRQIRMRLNFSDAGTTLNMMTSGWVDPLTD